LFFGRSNSRVVSLKNNLDVNLGKIKQFFLKQYFFWIFLNSFVLRSTIVVAERKQIRAPSGALYKALAYKETFSLKTSFCVVAIKGGSFESERAKRIYKSSRFFWLLFGWLC